MELNPEIVGFGKFASLLYLGALAAEELPQLCLQNLVKDL